MSTGRPRARTAVATAPPRDECCPHVHEAVELVGKRWTGAIVYVLLQHRGRCASARSARPSRALGPAALGAHEGARGPWIVERRVLEETPVRVEYELTPMGRDLGPALRALRTWGQRYLD
jgi:DNA-binding HxlR family transcriptional regulator